MTDHPLQRQARDEWSGSAVLRSRYPTFTHYWRERYQRVYRLPVRGALLHLAGSLRCVVRRRAA